MSLALLNASLFAVEALAASLILPLLAWQLCFLQRERAALRHLIWLAVFGALLLLPLLALLVPSQVMLHREPDAAIGYSQPIAIGMVDAAPAPLLSNSHIVIALAAVWAAGLCWNLLRLAAGLYGLHRLRRSGVPFEAGLDCTVRLAPTVPLTFGWLKPVILLPLDAPSWPQARLEAVLGHEWAHVGRRDNLSNGLALLACAVYWPNPFVWWARRAMCRAAEIAADNRVLAGGMRPSLYAAELLALTAEYRGRAPFAALAMASPSWLEVRVTTLLSPTQSRTDAAAIDIAGIAALGSAAALMLALVRPGVVEFPLSAVRPQGSASPAMAAPQSDLPPALPAPSSSASAPPPVSFRAGHVLPEGIRPVETGAAAVDAASGELPPATGSNPQDVDRDRASRDARLMTERIEREDWLRQKAVQRRIALDAKFARSTADREAMLNIKAAERSARLASEKSARDAAHDLL